MAQLEKIDDYRWLIPRQGRMRTHGLVFADETLLVDIRKDNALAQVMNVACLPGLAGPSLGMPDMHWGYGFPIGGVAAFDAEDGVISPGGVGYDINCGCRLMATRLTAPEVRPRLGRVVEALFQAVPCGVGARGALKLNRAELKKVLERGAAWAVDEGYGAPADLAVTEEQGAMPEAEATSLSERALERGLPQLGTLGSGNHFLELDVVEEIFDQEAARAFGLFAGQLVAQIHSGSRGLGYQVCDDFLKAMMKNAASLDLPDRQLIHAELSSPLGRAYYAAMSAAANYAWANRQVLMALAEQALLAALETSPSQLGWRLIYDVAHNIAKKETHLVEGGARKVVVHRKGATRAFAPGRPELPGCYRAVGQPVLVPGDMGSCSFVLAGREKAMEESFGSSCHGAGRRLSRTAAKKAARGRSIARELGDKGIFVRSQGRATLSEEMPEAYKDAARVVGVMHESGLAMKVARLKPLGVIKG